MTEFQAKIDFSTNKEGFLVFAIFPSNEKKSYKYNFLENLFKKGITWVGNVFIRGAVTYNILEISTFYFDDLISSTKYNLIGFFIVSENASVNEINYEFTT